MSATIRFIGPLLRPETSEEDGSWSLLTLPKNAGSKLPSQDGMMVEGTLNGFPFRALLESDGKASPSLRVSQALREAACADVGSAVNVEITRAGDEPEIRVPADLGKALKASPSAHALWPHITSMARRDWVLWIASAKQAVTRKRRIETACDMLASGKRRPCCFPGINWRTKDLVASDETWQPLPSSRNRPSTKAAK